jgi:hypothetical protein
MPTTIGRAAWFSSHKARGEKQPRSDQTGIERNWRRAQHASSTLIRNGTPNGMPEYPEKQKPLKNQWVNENTWRRGSLSKKPD